MINWEIFISQQKTYQLGKRLLVWKKNDQFGEDYQLRNE